MKSTANLKRDKAPHTINALNLLKIYRITTVVALKS